MVFSLSLWSFSHQVTTNWPGLRLACYLTTDKWPLCHFNHQLETTQPVILFIALMALMTQTFLLLSQGRCVIPEHKHTTHRVMHNYICPYMPRLTHHSQKLPGPVITLQNQAWKKRECTVNMWKSHTLWLAGQLSVLHLVRILVKYS